MERGSLKISRNKQGSVRYSKFIRHLWHACSLIRVDRRCIKKQGENAVSRSSTQDRRFVFLGYDTALLGKWILMFRHNLVSQSSKVKISKKVLQAYISASEDEYRTLLRKVRCDNPIKQRHVPGERSVPLQCCETRSCKTGTWNEYRVWFNKSGPNALQFKNTRLLFQVINSTGFFSLTRRGFLYKTPNTKVMNNFLRVDCTT